MPDKKSYNASTPPVHNQDTKPVEHVGEDQFPEVKDVTQRDIRQELCTLNNNPRNTD